ncbi:MAG: GNAT family N-acetyltransferase [Planctomycetota bacterium]
MASYGVPTNDAEREAVVRFCCVCFHPASLDGIREWIGAFDPSKLRLLRDDGGEPVATLTRLDMGQYFGGRVVSMSGVAAVAIPPERRGEGHAPKLMEAYVREARADGFALLALYASTQRLYRKSGYEQAGHCYITTIPPRCWETIPEVAGDDALTLRPATDADEPAIRACYDAAAALRNGELARGEDIWRYVRTRRGRTHDRVVVERSPGIIEGHCAYVIDSDPTDDLGGQRIDLHDLSYTTPAAAVRLVRFLSTFGTLGRSFRIVGGPTHPILSILRDHGYRAKLADHWFTRVLNVRTALEQRGYPAGLDTSVSFHIHDPLFEENSGVWRLDVKDRLGRVTHGGDASGAIALDIRAFASLFTGYLSASELSSIGRACTDDVSALRRADAAFAGPPPAMSTMF